MSGAKRGAEDEGTVPESEKKLKFDNQSVHPVQERTDIVAFAPSSPDELPSSAPSFVPQSELARESFARLFHDLPEKKVAYMMKIIAKKGFENETSFGRYLFELVGRDEEALSLVLRELSFEALDAKLIAKRLLFSANRFLPHQIRDRRQLTKAVSDCACPVDPHRPLIFVGLEKTLSFSMSIIRDHLKYTCRVPPLVISRMSRGGKTTILCELFAKLKLEGDIDPIFISFNGTLRDVKGLSQSESIIHMIATQITDPRDVGGRPIICDESILDEHLGDRQVVLLIDELNVLGYPTLDEEASALLKRMFLDKRNRYLVFSTHVPMSIDSTSSYMVSITNRTCIYVPFEPITVPAALAPMGPNYENISVNELAVYGGVPSLVYSSKDLYFNAEHHFDRISEMLEFNPSDLFPFLFSVITGALTRQITLYTVFGIVTEGKVYWPLCYILFLLKKFTKVHALTPQLETCYEGFHTTYHKLLSADTGSGKDWESLINLVIFIRCILSLEDHLCFPFVVIPSPLLTVTYLNITETDITAAWTVIEDAFQSIPEDQFPAAIIAIPSNATFPIVDGILAYSTDRTGSNRQYIGYQAKAGEGYPSKNASGLPDWMTVCYLLRGVAPPTTRGTVKSNWTYWDRRTIEALLGPSLAKLYPAYLEGL